jgi:hypothetical protein
MKRAVQYWLLRLSLPILLCALLPGQNTDPEHGHSSNSSKPKARSVAGRTTADPRTFVFKGLRLGMTPEQAEPIIEQIIKEPKEIDRDTYLGHKGVNIQKKTLPCFSKQLEELKEGEGRVYNDNQSVCIETMEIGEWRQTGSVALKLFFVEDFPSHPGNVHLWAIVFRQAGLKTSTDRATWVDAVTNKYGTPSFSSPEGPVVYCAEHVSGKTCRINRIERLDFPSDSMEHQVKIDPDRDSTSLTHLTRPYTGAPLSYGVYPALAKGGMYVDFGPAPSGGYGDGNFEAEVYLWDTSQVQTLPEIERRVVEKTPTAKKPEF